MRCSMAAALLILVCAGSAHAQSPFSFELRGGASIPAEDLGSSPLDAGGGFSFNVSARLLPHTLMYAGWDWNRLNMQTPLPGADSHIEDTGYVVGLMFRHPMLNRVDGWARAGAIYSHMEVETEDGDALFDSGHELGWEAGGGLFIPVGQRFALTPGVRYRTFSAGLDEGAGNVDLSYVALDIGLSYSFGGRQVRTAAR